jgi:hypothetical protein
MAPLTTSRVLSNYAPIGAGRRTSSFKALGVTDTAAPTYLSFTRPWHKVYFGLFYLLQHLTSKGEYLSWLCEWIYTLTQQVWAAPDEFKDFPGPGCLGLFRVV